MLYIIHLSHPRQIAPTTDILQRHTSHHPTFIISNIQTPPPPPARNHPKPPHRCPVCQFYSTLQHAEDTKARPLYPPSCQRDKIINWTCHIEPKLQELSVVFLRTINIHPNCSFCTQFISPPHHPSFDCWWSEECSCFPSNTTSEHVQSRKLFSGQWRRLRLTTLH